MNPPHPLALQSCVSVSSPGQACLCFSLAELSQVLVLVWYPGPHVLEHSDHSDHSLHPPTSSRGQVCPHFARYFSSAEHFPDSFFPRSWSPVAEQPSRDGSNPRARQDLSYFLILIFSFFFENLHLPSVSATKKTAMIAARKTNDFIITNFGA